MDVLPCCWLCYDAWRPIGFDRSGPRRRGQRRLTSPPRQKLTQILFLHEHRADDDQPLHQELHVGIDVLELQDIREQAEDEDADERSGEAAAPAHEARAADYYRGDRIEFEAGARVRFALPGM